MPKKKENNLDLNSFLLFLNVNMLKMENKNLLSNPLGCLFFVHVWLPRYDESYFFIIDKIGKRIKMFSLFLKMFKPCLITENA